MNLRFRLGIALRYVLTREQAPLSRFLSLLSVTGLVLAVALMAVVMSVMNGFDREMRTRVLAVIPHVSVMGAGASEMGEWVRDCAVSPLEVVLVQVLAEALVKH